ncbi:MAG: transcriptional repressor LexA [Clostridia bacterium]|jgi:repressor LexA
MKPKEIIIENFSTRLTEVMKEHSHTIYDLADILHLNGSTIFKYTSGQIVPKIVLVEYMARIYHVNPEWLRGDPDSERESSEPASRLIPIVGSVAAGLPLLAQENIEGYEAVTDDVKADYCLRVKGDSMINARINDGDIVFVRKQPEVNNGEIAVVLIGDEEATLKRFYKYGNTIMLRPENPKYDEIVLNKTDFKEVRILGKCIAVKFSLEV